MQIFENYSLKKKNSFGLNSIAKRYIAIESRDDFTKLRDYIDIDNYILLGGGSNVVLPEFIDGTVVEILIDEISYTENSDSSRIIKVDAGVVWDIFVRKSIEIGAYGFENLAAIPGKVGAAPIQNIGAYGIEQAKYFESLEAFDLKTGVVINMVNNDCEFAYRNSFFKKNKHDLIITSVTYKFADWKPVVNYKDVTEELKNYNSGEISPHLIYELITKIRSRKLPNPEIEGNAGSFFKNPVLPVSEYHSLIASYPDLTGNPDGENIKISAAKLIEKAEWKGKGLNDDSRIIVSPRHSLVLINLGGGTYKEIFDLSAAIIEDVKNKFGISLEREVNIIPS
ncbi:MAG: UDP-N-acetylmuramate dehydrogenase [Candidatus Kapabacteria bacterium]|nr:UDP-N-acetylmuramate dehydrogenase [Ignavibacteriota bacterium]MCW5885425.1 UDP-N-acetylmuramate dehydrogenase [Candidatus Kapabacteria bacterium]